MRVLLGIFLVLSCASCTYSITNVHTQGYADDVVDETQGANPDISPTVSFPVKAL